MTDENPQSKQPQSRDKTIIFTDKFKRKNLAKPHADDTGDQSKLVANQQKMMLFIHGMVEKIDFEKTPIVILGRFDLRAKTDDEIDLGTYGAVEHGVSRTHCQLELQGDQIVVTDLGSSNGTFVSGNRLEPNQPYILQKGEELILGRLPIQFISRP